MLLQLVHLLAVLATAPTAGISSVSSVSLTTKPAETVAVPVTTIANNNQAQVGTSVSTSKPQAGTSVSTSKSQVGTAVSTTNSNAPSSQDITYAQTIAANDNSSVKHLSGPNAVVTVTVQAKCGKNDSSSTSSTSSSSKPTKEVLCVKCYDKIIRSSDCKKCKMVCDDGTVTESIKPTNCPNTNAKDVPCACKDAAGNVIKDNYYKTSELPIKKIGLVEDYVNLSN